MVGQAAQTLRRWVLGFCQSQRAATTAEYAMLLVLVVVVVISGLTKLGRVLDHKLDVIVRDINRAH